MRSFTYRLITAGVTAAVFFSACKSKPVPPEASPPLSAPSLVFERIEAENPDNLNIFFTLNIVNPFPFAGRAKIESWEVELNGKFSAGGTNASGSFVLEYPGNGEYPLKAALSGGKPAPESIPLTLNMDVASLAARGLAPEDEYRVNLILELGFSGEAAGASPAFPGVFVSGLAVFPGVQPPEFSITAIAILKAELINTRFRVGLRIDNPNPYPVELSAFGYVLYGNGRLWADGTEKNIIKVPGKSAVTGNLFLIMNFINMKRDLLDQIIALEDVNYRFTGEALVLTGVDYLPRFKTGFDLSGYSEVLEK